MTLAPFASALVFTLALAAGSFDRGPVHVVTSDDPKRIDWSVTVPAS
ncbi:MAG: hypothetical protein JO140_03725, partial [Candidatus Eremiobacteraeota bacterium]|nr:hypothetical protein [Candidatus Eremiobacteraeota bacterium]